MSYTESLNSINLKLRIYVAAAAFIISGAIVYFLTNKFIEAKKI